jgi:biotin carboxyl carrier protein
MNYEVGINEKTYRLELHHADGQWRCRLNGTAMDIDAVLVRPTVLSILLDGKAYEIKRELRDNDLHLWVGGSRYAVEIRDLRSLRHRRDGATTSKGPQKLTAAMPGKVVRILLQEREQVEAGQGILVVEAMKMQNEIKSSKSGVIQKIMVAEGGAVNAGDVVAIVE